MSQQWNQDFRIEHLAQPFIDANFYDKVFPNRYERTENLNEQYSGIDVKVYSKDGNPVFIDEKYKVYKCLNSVYPYPGFEISFVNKAGNVQDGWFVDKHKVTQIYATIGLSATVDDIKNLKSTDQITGADVLLNTRKSILDYVQQFTSIQDILKDSQDLRSCLIKRRKHYSHGKFWLTFSANKDEKPVNLVIPRETLEYKLPHSAHYCLQINQELKKL